MPGTVSAPLTLTCPRQEASRRLAQWRNLCLSPRGAGGSPGHAGLYHGARAPPSGSVQDDAGKTLTGRKRRHPRALQTTGPRRAPALNAGVRRPKSSISVTTGACAAGSSAGRRVSSQREARTVAQFTRWLFYLLWGFQLAPPSHRHCPRELLREGPRDQPQHPAGVSARTSRSPAPKESCMDSEAAAGLRPTRQEQRGRQNTCAGAQGTGGPACDSF